MELGSYRVRKENGLQLLSPSCSCAGAVLRTLGSTVGTVGPSFKSHVAIPVLAVVQGMGPGLTPKTCIPKRHKHFDDLGYVQRTV